MWYGWVLVNGERVCVCGMVVGWEIRRDKGVGEDGVGWFK